MGKARPWNEREVVVLVVISDVPRQEVEWTIVRKGFLWGRNISHRSKSVVLRHKVTRARMQRSRPEHATDEVDVGSPPEPLHPQRIEQYLHHPVGDQVSGQRKALRRQKRSYRVGDDLKRQPHETKRPVTCEKSTLPFCRNVPIDTETPLGCVMSEMVRAKRDREWDANGKIDEHGK